MPVESTCDSEELLSTAEVLCEDEADDDTRREKQACKDELLLRLFIQLVLLLVQSSLILQLTKELSHFVGADSHLVKHAQNNRRRIKVAVENDTRRLRALSGPNFDDRRSKDCI